jgi:hypothetical protein
VIDMFERACWFAAGWFLISLLYNAAKLVVSGESAGFLVACLAAGCVGNELRRGFVAWQGRG